MTRLDQLKDALARHLTRIRNDPSCTYIWPASELPTVISRMQAAIDKAGGLRGISIDSATFRAMAKDFGINNTYKAWAAWLAQEGASEAA